MFDLFELFSHNAQRILVALGGHINVIKNSPIAVGRSQPVTIIPVLTVDRVESNLQKEPYSGGQKDTTKGNQNGSKIARE